LQHAIELSRVVSVARGFGEPNGVGERRPELGRLGDGIGEGHRAVEDVADDFDDELSRLRAGGRDGEIDHAGSQGCGLAAGGATLPSGVKPRSAICSASAVQALQRQQFA
jgi:hypothetical protein